MRELSIICEFSVTCGLSLTFLLKVSSYSLTAYLSPSSANGKATQRNCLPVLITIKLCCNKCSTSGIACIWCNLNRVRAELASLTKVVVVPGS
jgi:hypothetical protein